LSITLTLPFPPTTNHLFINAGRKRVRSPKYRAWAEEAGWQLNAQKARLVPGPVALHYEFQEGQDKRKRDIGNLEKGLTDLLVTHGVIEADDGTIVREINLRWSREVVGVRVTIKEAA
jgi:crossover junction endodeoxyribonuclease RusA